MDGDYLENLTRIMKISVDLCIEANPTSLTAFSYTLISLERDKIKD